MHETIISGPPRPWASKQLSRPKSKSDPSTLETYEFHCIPSLEIARASTCRKLYFQVQDIKCVCARRSLRGIQSTNAQPASPSRGHVMSCPMGSSVNSQKVNFMSWADARPFNSSYDRIVHVFYMVLPFCSLGPWESV